MKQIDGHAMIQRVEALLKAGRVDLNYYNIVREAVQMEPEVDAAPVVRCKDCKHYFPDCTNTIGGNVVIYRCELDHDYGRDDYFCADGERANSPTCGPDYCEIGGEDDAR